MLYAESIKKFLDKQKEKEKVAETGTGKPNLARIYWAHEAANTNQKATKGPVTGRT